MSVNGHDPKVSKRLARYAEAIRLVDEGKARPQVVAAVECIRAGMNGLQAAERLGIAKSTLYQRLNDPTDEKNHNRKLAHYGTCARCGAPTAYGVGGAAEYCRKCAPDAYAFWTREVIVEAIREYHRRYDRPPGAMDWNLAMAREKADPRRWAEVKERWDEGIWPVTTHVLNRFGKWNTAIEAAGFISRGAGHRRPYYTDDDLIAALREVGTLNCTEYERRCNGRPCLHTICNRFGGWRKALDAAGLTKDAA